VTSLQKGASPVSKLILKMSMSLDGFVADASGDNAFIFSSMSEDAVAWTMDTLGDTAAHLMGSNTYHDMAAHWPASDSVFAAPMNDIPKIVFSHSMTTAEWGETRIVAGDLAEGVAKLKAERAGGYLLAHGGARFARSLVSTGLIDEYRLLVHPAVLGDGKPIFPGRMDLEPVSTTAFSSGAVAHVCRGAGN
jgi:dihydrofolate reductase